jgi:pyruvate/2-oxoglutarate dehydrogenase complex dihydrolipoamide acyltransferase (E2) component
MSTQIIMPQLGESVVEGTVIQWLKQPGDTVKEFEPILEVETDKVAVEVPASASGTLLEILVPEGRTVQAGTVLARIGEAGETGGGIDTLQPKAASPQGAAGSVAIRQAGRDAKLGFISPVVAKMAREYHLDLALIRGSGERGRITKKDVMEFLGMNRQGDQTTKRAEEGPKDPPAPWEMPADGDLFRPTEMVFAGQPGAVPPLDLSKTPTVPAAPEMLPLDLSLTAVKGRNGQPLSADGDELLPITAMRRTIADAMVLSKRSAPHATTIMEADMSRVAAHRAAQKSQFEREGVHLTYTAYFGIAALQALRAFPMVNSSWSEAGIQLHHRIHLGFAVALGEEGLIVPVIRDADALSLLGLARGLNDLARRGRARKLKPDEVKDGTFTITNHGTGGSLFATPVINPPQCGILGIGAIQKRVVVVSTTPELGMDDLIAVRPMVYLSFTFDHRILDGRAADAFLGRIKAVLEGWT